MRYSFHLTNLVFHDVMVSESNTETHERNKAMTHDSYLGVKMPSDLRKELQELARKEDRSENSVVRLALLAQRPLVARV
jgi:hypothetical protein